MQVNLEPKNHFKQIDGRMHGMTNVRNDERMEGQKDGVTW